MLYDLMILVSLDKTCSKIEPDSAYRYFQVEDTIHWVSLVNVDDNYWEGIKFMCKRLKSINAKI